MTKNRKEQRRPYKRPAMRVVQLAARHIVCQSMPTKDTPTPYQW